MYIVRIFRHLTALVSGLVLSGVTLAGPLHDAAEIGNLQAAQMLIAQSSDVNAVDEHGIWPLLGAAHHGNARLVELLISHGADVQQTDAYGYTALHAAAAQAQLAVARRLIAAHADINARDISGFSALTYALRSGSPEMVQLLRQHGGMPCRSGIGKPRLHNAHWQGA